MSKTITELENGVTIKYHFDESYADNFADGFGPAMIGFPFTKLLMYREEISHDAEDKVMHRKIVGTLTVPTAAFLQTALNVKSALLANEESVTQAIDASKAILFSK